MCGKMLSNVDLCMQQFRIIEFMLRLLYENAGFVSDTVCMRFKQLRGFNFMATFVKFVKV